LGFRSNLEVILEEGPIVDNCLVSGLRQAWDITGFAENPAELVILLKY